MAGGRFSRYTDEVGTKICQRLAAGESLRAIAKSDDVPSIPTIQKWLRNHPDFASQYARARVDQADAIFEECLEIADDAANDFIETGRGLQVNGENVQRSRLRVDTRKWMLGKLAPKKYGERIEHEMTGKVEVEHSAAREEVTSRIAGITARIGTPEDTGEPN